MIEIKKLLADSEHLHGHLGTLESNMGGVIPVCMFDLYYIPNFTQLVVMLLQLTLLLQLPFPLQPKLQLKLLPKLKQLKLHYFSQCVPGSQTHPEPPRLAPAKLVSINLSLLDDAVNELNGISAPAKKAPAKVAVKQPEPAPATSKLKLELLDDKLLAPINVVSKKDHAPRLQDDETKRDISDHRAPNAAEGSAGAVDSSSQDRAHQQKIIGASVGGSVAGVVLVCGIVAAVVISKKRKRGKQEEVASKSEDAEDLDDYTSTEDVE
ncbi:hypothetical protein Ciccas_005495 [Cichlidogyrus casuarinus]|uniref:Uncharacterized protein n=1 Tax=Cichlidogyrus casuarinus TaxID=1844966 RepID=A0ABD2Q8H0_9PLAT